MSWVVKENRGQGMEFTPTTFLGIRRHQGDNDNHCFKCRSTGELIECDFCSKSFHLACLQPALKQKPDDFMYWACPKCIRKVYDLSRTPLMWLYESEAEEPTKKRARTDSTVVGDVFEIRAKLLGAAPEAWRIIHVPRSAPLTQLHGILQICFNWSNSHLYQFETAFGQLFMPQHPNLPSMPDSGMEVGPLSTKIDELFLKLQDKLLYRYDLGEDWEVVLELIGSHPTDPMRSRIACIDGWMIAPREHAPEEYRWEEFWELRRIYAKKRRTKDEKNIISELSTSIDRLFGVRFDIINRHLGRTEGNLRLGADYHDDDDIYELDEDYFLDYGDDDESEEEEDDEEEQEHEEYKVQEEEQQQQQQQQQLQQLQHQQQHQQQQLQQPNPLQMSSATSAVPLRVTDTSGVNITSAAIIEAEERQVAQQQASMSRIMQPPRTSSRITLPR